MAKNFVQPGEVLTFTAPYAVSSGSGFKAGLAFAVAMTDAASGSQVEGQRRGVWDLTKNTGEAWTAFATKLYWDDTNRRVTSTAGSNIAIGLAGANAASADAVGRVVLYPQI